MFFRKQQGGRPVRDGTLLQYSTTHNVDNTSIAKGPPFNADVRSLERCSWPHSHSQEVWQDQAAIGDLQPESWWYDQV
jgi:hypothetical protein